MEITNELVAAYAASALPYTKAEGPIPADVLGLKSWRYLIELNTACNLRCALCTVGNREGYDYNHANGIMDMDLLDKVLDKMHSENPNAIVCPYGNGEPLLHPHLASCIAAIKKRGFRCEMATNLNRIAGMEEVLLAKPDFVIISVSGFTQEVYGKSHKGGNVEKVKENLKTLKEIVDRIQCKSLIAVSYHMYEDNLHEVEAMREFVSQFGFLFMLSWARTISMENTIQALRHIDKEAGVEVPPYQIMKSGLDLNTAFPPANPSFMENMKRLRFHPKKARELYKQFPVPSVCIIADVFTYIRHDGQVQLCAWCDDRRLVLGDYLSMNQEQLSESRRGNPLCQECLKYRMNLYYHVVDCNKWDGMGDPQPTNQVTT